MYECLLLQAQVGLPGPIGPTVPCIRVPTGENWGTAIQPALPFPQCLPLGCFPLPHQEGISFSSTLSVTWALKGFDCKLAGSSGRGLQRGQAHPSP